MASEQTKLDNNIKDILNILKADVVVNVASSTLLDLIDRWMMSPRQIAKKITSLSSTIPLTDRELNLMFYGQDLAAIYPDYVPYETETEDMVKYDTDYEPFDIRDMYKDKITDLKIEVRMAVKNLDIMIKQLVKGALAATKQFVSTIAVAPIKLVPGPTFDAFGLQSLALALHAAVNALRVLVNSVLSIMPIFTSVPEIHGPVSTITIPHVQTPGMNGASAIKVPMKGLTLVIPKLSLLLSEKNLEKVLKPVNVVLEVLKVVADIIVAMDIALAILDGIALVLPDPDINSAAKLLT